MTTTQILLMDCLYLVLLGALSYFTRATARRITGALAGGAVAGLWAIGAITLAEAQGWWRVSSNAVPYFWLQVYLGLAISMAPVYLITWRVARRFGRRGLAVCLAVAAVIGPPRDYLIAAMFPEWMVFRAGLVPVLADATTYVGVLALGHTAMRLVAGPALRDRLTFPPAGAA